MKFNEIGCQSIQTRLLHILVPSLPTTEQGRHFGAKLDQGQGQGQGRTTTGRLILTYWTTTTTENGTTSRRSHANSHPAGSFFAWHQIQDRRTHLPTRRILEY